ncbi:MAG: response regulator [Elusimicrobia bacterium]|nr:response regulator [Elusimicrobiota bacterium]
MRALIVDDDIALSHLLSRCLGLWGWVPDEAPRVSAALEFFKQGSYDLLLCDVDLPDGDGITLSRALLKVNPFLAVVIISGNPENLRRARKVGLASCLRKPFSLDDLRALIDLKCAGES